MGFSDVRHLPRIASYDEAAFRFKNIKPIRGTDIRPLGTRRAKHYAIEQRGESYVCTLYGHPVIIFSKDEYGRGELTVNLCGYNTITTRAFVRWILATPCYNHDAKAYICAGRYHYYLPDNYPLQIKLGKAVNPVTATKRVLDQEVTKTLRDTYRQEMDTAEALMGLVNNENMDIYYEANKRYSDYGRQFLDDLTREEVTDYLFCAAIYLRGSSPAGMSYLSHKDLIRNGLYTVAMRDNIEIYKTVEMAVGELPVGTTKRRFSYN